MKLIGSNITDEEIRGAEDKFAESLLLAQTGMYNLLANDVEQVSQMVTFAEGLLDFHQQCTEILKIFVETLQQKREECANRPRPEFVPKTLADLNTEGLGSTEELVIQDQIYILSAALVVVTVVLLIFCIVLCISVSRLKTIIRNWEKKDIATRESKYAYNNPTIQPDEELHHRGYLMHKGQIVPRVTSPSNGGYSTDLSHKSAKPSSVYSQSSRDFIPINDIKASKDASRNFKSIVNPSSSVFDDDISYNESQPVSSRIPITVNNGIAKRYTPPRPSQFNSNITLGQGQSETRQDGVTYFNNRAIDY